MTKPAFLASPYFYFSWLGLWLISLLILGSAALPVVPGMLLFFLPGFLIGEKLLGPLKKENPAPLVAAILLGFFFSGFTLLLSGTIWGFLPLPNILSLILINALTFVFFNDYQLTDYPVAPASPQFSRKDYYALLGALVFLVLFVLPAYLNVGRLTSAGYAYTQWFSLDFLISKTVTAAISHGKLPPLTPSYIRLPLRYHYWFHILPAYLYQLAGCRLNLENLLLLLYFLADAVFLGSVYLLFCEKLATFQARLAALVLLLAANSLEGVFFIFDFLGEAPLKNLLYRNLEMIFVPSLLTPYVHLLYIVPHLFTAAYFYLIYQLIKKRPHWLSYLLAGLLIGASFGLSVFMGAMLLWYALLIFIQERIWLAKRWGWLTLFGGGILLVYLWLGGVLQMFAKTDTAAIRESVPASVLQQNDKLKLAPGLFWIDRFNLREKYDVFGPYIQIGAECLPALVFLFWGIYLLYRQKKLGDLSPEVILALGCLFAYLFIAPDKTARIISHKVSLPLYLFSAYIGGVVFEANPQIRKAAWGILMIFLVLAAPTLLINFGYINNVNNSWEATYLSAPDYQAANWIKNNLPANAVIQPFPSYPAWPHDYSLIPMFAERNTGVGAYAHVRDALLSPSLTLYEINKIVMLFLPQTPLAISKRLIKEYQIGYLYFGPLELKKFGSNGLAFLQSQRDLYQEVYNQGGVVIFQVKNFAE